jgi:hypothetical protein
MFLVLLALACCRATPTTSSCGDVTSAGVDHLLKAKDFEKAGNLECTLVHRKIDADTFADADAYYNLALAYENLER